MLRYDRQTKPGLVALYDIRPGNGAGPFLQPRSPHGAESWMTAMNASAGASQENLQEPLQGTCATSSDTVSYYHLVSVHYAISGQK